MLCMHSFDFACSIFVSMPTYMREYDSNDICLKIHSLKPFTLITSQSLLDLAAISQEEYKGGLGNNNY